jgi:hypothetical protein
MQPRRLLTLGVAGLMAATLTAAAQDIETFQGGGEADAHALMLKLSGPQ